LPSEKKKSALIDEGDLTRIERAHPDGLTSAQIIQIFKSRGAKLSEATFRKYIQLGLLPRSKRVGTKGKHKGSHGIYPCVTVRRINSIKTMMARGYTIEEIQRNFANFKQKIDEIEAVTNQLIKSFERALAEPRIEPAQRRKLIREIAAAKKNAGELIRRVTQIETHLAWQDKELSVPGSGTLTRFNSRKR